MRSFIKCEDENELIIVEPMVVDVVESSMSSEGTDEDNTASSNGETSAKESHWEGTRRRFPRSEKRTEEYRRQRQLNNVAVKKSRDKARQKQKECISRLESLTSENKKLHMKVEVLVKELSLLRGLFPVVGLTPPPEANHLISSSL